MTVSILILLEFLTGTMTQRSGDGCRFAYKYTREELITSPDARDSFLLDIALAEGKFQSNGVGYDVTTGHTYDGHMLDYNSGELLEGGLHTFSAPSKESIHVAILALALEGNDLAQKFVLSSSQAIKISLTEDARNFSINLLSKKLDSYEEFNATFPGFGGFLPWVKIVGDHLEPADGWSNQVCPFSSLVYFPGASS